jgi:hypothetical protein
MKFRKKPVVIEATQWFKNGDHTKHGKGAAGADSAQSAYAVARDEELRG